MVNCNYENFGCMGGYLMTSLDYLQIEGAVSNTCVPYEFERGSCSYRCADPKSHETYDKYYCSMGSLRILTTYEDIKREISTNGPMMFGLEIYEDFMSYSEGVYVHHVGELVGGHAMKAIGYGEDQEEGLYWIL